MANKKRKPSVFQLIQRNDNPATRGKFYPISYRVPSVDEIFDEETGKSRKIRYVIGEQSIYADEQKENNPAVGDIVFTNGSLIAPYQKPTLIEFLRKSNYNSDNPDKMPGSKIIFYEINNEIDAQKEVEALESEFMAIEMAMGLSPQEVIGICKVLGINVDRSMYEIKHDFLRFVKENPADFVDSLDDPRVDRKQKLIDAFDAGIIIHNTGSKTINWGGKNGQAITIVPVGVDHLEHISEYTFEKEGEEVYSRICRLLEKSLKIDDAPEFVAENEMIEVETKPKKKTSSKK